MYPGTGFPFQEHRENISRKVRGDDNPYLTPMSHPVDSYRPPRLSHLPTTREYLAYVTSFVTGLTLSHVAQNDNVEEIVGHISSQILNVLGASVAATSLLRWMLHECGLIKKGNIL